MKMNKVDRRINRTKKLIRDSLFTLMQQMPYERIRISHIANVADISRSTFYLHYETKEDLLTSVLDEIINKYLSALDLPETQRQENPTHLLFSLWEKNMKEMRLIVRAGLESRIYERLRASNIQHTHIENIKNDVLNDYVHEMINGAEFGLLLRWTKDGGNIPVSQMEKLYNSLKIRELFETIEKEIPDFGK